jgi:hypothetical protein
MRDIPEVIEVVFTVALVITVVFGGALLMTVAARFF